MGYDDICEDLKSASFEFFYWFSRFEYVLKENGLLKSKQPRAKAEPCWSKFIEKYKKQYKLTDAAKSLIKLHPKRQVVLDANQLDWEPVGRNHGVSQLEMRSPAD